MLRAVSFDVKPGQRIVISGASGSGKSTILRCIVGLERSEGLVSFHGDPVGPDNILEVRRRVMLVSQTPSAVGDTVAENLDFARTMAGGGAELQERLLERFELHELPRDREFDRLSVGERQRLCFVRAMTIEPQVLLLDEPTSALDERNASTVERVVDEWLAEDDSRAAVWITHDSQQSARVADRTLRLTGGVLREDA